MMAWTSASVLNQVFKWKNFSHLKIFFLNKIKLTKVNGLPDVHHREFASRKLKEELNFEFMGMFLPHFFLFVPTLLFSFVDQCQTCHSGTLSVLFISELEQYVFNFPFIYYFFYLTRVQWEVTIKLSWNWQLLWHFRSAQQKMNQWKYL